MVVTSSHQNTQQEPARPPTLAETTFGKENLAQGFPKWVLNDLDHDPVYVSIYSDWVKEYLANLNSPSPEEISIRSTIAKQQLTYKDKPMDAVSFMNAMSETKDAYNELIHIPINKYVSDTEPTKSRVGQAIINLLRELAPPQYKPFTYLYNAECLSSSEISIIGVLITEDETTLMVLPYSPLYKEATRIVTTDTSNKLEEYTL